MTEEKKETVRVTAKVFQALLNTTADDLGLHSPMKRHLVQSLHAAEVESSGRWVMTVTQADLRIAYRLLEDYCLNRPTQRMRLMHVMCRESDFFTELYRETERRKEAR